MIPPILSPRNKNNPIPSTNIPTKLIGYSISFRFRRKRSNPNEQRIASEKSVKNKRRVGWAVERNGILRRYGSLAKGVGSAKIRDRKKIVPKKNVFLSRRKNSANNPKISGIIPT